MKPSSAKSAGVFALVLDWISLSLTSSNLRSAANYLDLRGAAELFTPAGVWLQLIPWNGGFCGISGDFSRYCPVPLRVSILSALVWGPYLHPIHTTNNPSGEIRVN